MFNGGRVSDCLPGAGGAGYVPWAIFIPAAPGAVLLLGWSVVVWVAVGMWWQIYDRIDASHSRVILRDHFPAVFAGTVVIVLFEFALRLDLSRSFLAMFAVFAWRCCGGTFECGARIGHDAAWLCSQLHHGGGAGRRKPCAWDGRLRKATS